MLIYGPVQTGVFDTFSARENSCLPSPMGTLPPIPHLRQGIKSPIVVGLLNFTRGTRHQSLPSAAFLEPGLFRRLVGRRANRNFRYFCESAQGRVFEALPLTDLEKCRVLGPALAKIPTRPFSYAEREKFLLSERPPSSGKG